MNLSSIKFWLIGFVTAIFVAVTSPSTLLAETKAPVVEHTVIITGFKFVPETLSVRVGDTITWRNDDIAPHTATASDKSWNTGKLKRGEQKSLLVTDSFLSTYFCKFHPVMKAKLKISIAN